MSSSKDRYRTLVSVSSSHLTAARVLFSEDGTVRITDFREKPAEHLYRGQWNDLEASALELRSLLEGLGGVAATAHKSIDLILTHEHIKSYEFGTSMTWGPEHDSISMDDVQTVHDQTRRVITVPLSERIISSYVQEYTVNDLNGIRDPIGIAGERLGVKMILFSIPVNLAKQIEKIFELNGLTVSSWYPRALAWAHAVLDADRKRQSTLLIHVGSSLSECIGFEHQQLKFYKPLAAGIETVSSLVQKAHPMPAEEAMAFTKQYAGFGARKYEQEMLPYRPGENTEPAYVAGKDFNTYLGEGLARITDALAETIKTAQKSFSQLPSLVVGGEGIALGHMLESLEEKAGASIPVAGIIPSDVQHPPISSGRFAALLGRVMLLKDEDEAERRRREAVHPLMRASEGIRRWMAEHF